MLARLHYGHKQEEGVLTQTDGVKTGASVVRVILWTTLDTEPEGHAPALCTFLCVCVYVSRGVSVLSAFVSSFRSLVFLAKRRGAAPKK